MNDPIGAFINYADRQRDLKEIFDKRIPLLLPFSDRAHYVNWLKKRTSVSINLCKRQNKARKAVHKNLEIITSVTNQWKRKYVFCVRWTTIYTFSGEIIRLIKTLKKWKPNSHDFLMKSFHKIWKQIFGIIYVQKYNFPFPCHSFFMLSKKHDSTE